MRNVLTQHEGSSQVVNVARLASVGAEGEGVEPPRLSELSAQEKRDIGGVK